MEKKPMSGIEIVLIVGLILVIGMALSDICGIHEPITEPPPPRPLDP